KLAGIARRERCDGLFHAGDVGRRLEIATAAEDEMILRIEPNHRHLGVQISAYGREDRFENPGIEEEGRPQVKTEAVRADRRGPAADPRLTLQHGHVVTRPGQQHRTGQAAGSRTDDDDSFRSGHDGGRTPIIVCSPRRVSRSGDGAVEKVREARLDLYHPADVVLGSMSIASVRGAATPASGTLGSIASKTATLRPTGACPRAVVRSPGILPPVGSTSRIPGPGAYRENSREPPPAAA